MIGEFKHIANVIQIYSEKLIKSLADVEVFDESWNGSPEPYEPERHWKLSRKDKAPMLAMRYILSGGASSAVM